MCGRLNVVDSPLVQALCLAIGVDIGTPPPGNADVRPTQRVLTIGGIDGQLARIDTTWGIQPAWAKKLLINAQAESVAEKRTFKDAFQRTRCLVPCVGYYEWRDEGGSRKQKYHFHDPANQGLLMAGIYYPGDTPELVTLTTAPNTLASKYHH
ncbi:SOS response-associated peptidase [Gilvimarinus chinensis]|uniref:SOS response-associated peptidase n=1 Tax=Gilvimarinus chinensis TaxID=396005 RepID=UPI000374EB61|nr:SOS response-associated peptidase [Gilvimarinus chinensis]